MSKTCSSEQKTEFNVSRAYTRGEQQAMVRAGLRCQICNARGKLFSHWRINNHADDATSDVLVLCRSCSELAQVCKRKRTRKRCVCVLRLLCLITLNGVATTVILALASFLSHLFFLLCMTGIVAVFLLVWLEQYW
jgi:hypothetical protein